MWCNYYVFEEGHTLKFTGKLNKDTWLPLFFSSNLRFLRIWFFQYFFFLIFLSFTLYYAFFTIDFHTFPDTFHHVLVRQMFPVLLDDAWRYLQNFNRQFKTDESLKMFTQTSFAISTFLVYVNTVKWLLEPLEIWIMRSSLKLHINSVVTFHMLMWRWTLERERCVWNSWNLSILQTDLMLSCLSWNNNSQIQIDNISGMKTISEKSNFRAVVLMQTMGVRHPKYLHAQKVKLKISTLRKYNYNPFHQIIFYFHNSSNFTEIFQLDPKRWCWTRTWREQFHDRFFIFSFRVSSSNKKLFQWRHVLTLYSWFMRSSLKLHVHIRVCSHSWPKTQVVLEENNTHRTSPSSSSRHVSVPKWSMLSMK